MQFLWKYIDDLVGKGLEWYIIAELLLYTSASLVPMALPLAILLSSIMTFGNLGEHYELVAMKSAGISLQRIMLPLIMLSIIISFGAFYFSNVVLPQTNLKMGTLLFDVRQQKPALNIKEGIFYNGIENFNIRVSKKGKDGRSLQGIMIYDHSLQNGNLKVLTADSGKMEFSNGESYLILNLKKGFNYEEILNKGNMQKQPAFVRSKFDEEIVRFDLTSFKLSRSDEELFKDNFQMLNINQLDLDIDTLTGHLLQQQNQYRENFRKSHVQQFAVYESPDSVLKQMISLNPDSIKANTLANFFGPEKIRILEISKEHTRNTISYLNTMKEDLRNKIKNINRYKIEWHRKFTLSIACLILFFVGAPLGAIIRKGGLGMPVVVSVGLFLIFHILSITGEKFVKEGVWEAVEGMWLATLILLPLGVFLTYKATRDSSIFEIESYKRPLRKLISRS